MTVLMNYSALIDIALFCENNCIFVSSSALSIAQVWRSHEDVLRPIPCLFFVCCFVTYTHIQDACRGPGMAIAHPMSCVKCGYHPWGRQVVLSQQACFMLYAIFRGMLYSKKISHCCWHKSYKNCFFKSFHEPRGLRFKYKAFSIYS